eukprot:6180488-Pleurochrysis_carterae.AAC.5
MDAFGRTSKGNTELALGSAMSMLSRIWVYTTLLFQLSLAGLRLVTCPGVVAGRLRAANSFYANGKRYCEFYFNPTTHYSGQIYRLSGSRGSCILLIDEKDI